MEAVVTATAHVDDSTWYPAVSAEAAEMTVAETPTSRTPNTARMITARMTAEAAGMPATEATTAEVTTAATEVAAESGRIGRRERADWNRNGGRSEHRFDCLADHRTLQCDAGRFDRFGD